MADDGGNVVPRITKAEHISPEGTGDNIHAKRVAPYAWNGSTWERTGPGQAGFITSSYDYVAITYPDDVTEVFTFKTGGSGGTTVNTVTLTYEDDTKARLVTVVRA